MDKDGRTWTLSHMKELPLQRLYLRGGSKWTKFDTAGWKDVSFLGELLLLLCFFCWKGHFWYSTSFCKCFSVTNELHTRIGSTHASECITPVRSLKYFEVHHFERNLKMHDSSWWRNHIFCSTSDTVFLATTLNLGFFTQKPFLRWTSRIRPSPSIEDRESALCRQSTIHDPLFAVNPRSTIRLSTWIQDPKSIFCRTSPSIHDRRSALRLESTILRKSARRSSFWTSGLYYADFGKNWILFGKAEISKF